MNEGAAFFCNTETCWCCGDSGVEIQCDDCGTEVCACCAVAFGGDVHRCGGCTGRHYHNEGLRRQHARALDVRVLGAPGEPAGDPSLTWVSWRSARKVHLLHSRGLATACGRVPGSRWGGSVKGRCQRCAAKLKNWMFFGMPIPGMEQWIPKPVWIGRDRWPEQVEMGDR